MMDKVGICFITTSLRDYRYANGRIGLPSEVVEAAVLVRCSFDTEEDANDAIKALIKAQCVPLYTKITPAISNVGVRMNILHYFIYTNTEYYEENY